MSIQKFKDVIIGGREFRIGLVSALIGDWIVAQMVAKRVADPDVFAKIQTQILDVCSVYVEIDGEKIPKKVFSNGRFLVPDLDLDSDLQLLHDLTNEALGFNFTPFLQTMEARAKAMAEESATSL